MLLSNSYKPDPRVAREVHALVKNGYEVTVFCWDRKCELPAQEWDNGARIIRVQNIQSAYGLGWQQVFYLPQFWQQAVHAAVELRPDIVHCHDLDTLYAGWRIKRRLHCSLVYDAHENYPAVMSLYLPSAFIELLEKLQNWLVLRADAIITASTVLRDEFGALGLSPVVTLGNFQDMNTYASVNEAEVLAVHSRLGVQPDDVLVAYIGGFSNDRMLIPFVHAAELMPQVEFHLWGDGVQRSAVEQAVAQQPNAHYHGWLSAADLPCYFKAIDIIYYGLRLDYPGAIYNAPNTLGQAMAAGRPVIANDVGDLGRIVRSAHCGVLIEEASPGAIANAITYLLNPLVRTELGTNGLQVAQKTYNAATVERQLVELYRTLSA